MRHHTRFIRTTQNARYQQLNQICKHECQRVHRKCTYRTSIMNIKENNEHKFEETKIDFTNINPRRNRGSTTFSTITSSIWSVMSPNLLIPCSNSSAQISFVQFDFVTSLRSMRTEGPELSPLYYYSKVATAKLTSAESAVFSWKCIEDQQQCTIPLVGVVALAQLLVSTKGQWMTGSSYTTTDFWKSTMERRGQSVIARGFSQWMPD